MDLTLANISSVVLAIGALGAAAYGIVEAFGKAFASSKWVIVDEATGEIAASRLTTLGTRFRGLPYVGFEAVQALMRPLAPALKTAYGIDYQQIVLRQYRNGRGAGEAPATIRQGVRMGLTLLSPDDIRYVLASNWGLTTESATHLANALAVRNETLIAGDTPTSDAHSESLMSTFVTVLDARLEAAFSLAEERYVASARMWAALASIGLVVGLNWIAIRTADDVSLPWEVALFIGLVAVPLAPATKDLAKVLSDAVGAFRSLRLTR